MNLLLAAAMTAVLAVPTLAAGPEVYIGVDGAKGGRTTWVLGLGPFLPDDVKSKEDTEVGRVLRDVVRGDLLFSRYFDLVEQGPTSDVTDPKAMASVWKSRGAAFLLEATASRKDSQAVLDVKLTDLSSGEALLSRHYRQSADFTRSLGHRVADDIVRQMTGRRGVAGTRIAFINDQTGAKEVYVVDYDGERPQRITNNRSINLFPRWHPDGRILAFTSYKGGNPDLFIVDLEKGRPKELSQLQGLNLAGGFSPNDNGARLAATVSRGKNPNIFIIELATGESKRVTTQSGVEASPTFSPDGQWLAYVSDLSGNPQVYTQELATGRTRRLTRMNWCDSPAWSPTGEWIAYAGRANVKDTFDIFLVDVAGTKTIQLTHGEGSNEDPSWSPDGRFLIFTSTRDKRRRLYMMDADGSAPHPLGDAPGNSFTPAWGLQ